MEHVVRWILPSLRQNLLRLPQAILPILVFAGIRFCPNGLEDLWKIAASQ